MRFKVIFLVVIVMFFIGSAVMAQSWSEEQLEVWNNVNTVFKAAAGDDLDLVKGYFSENYGAGMWIPGIPSQDNGTDCTLDGTFFR